MAKQVSVTLIDDIDGSIADESVIFGLDGREFRIDLNAVNAAKLRETLDYYIEKSEIVLRRGRKPGVPRSNEAALIREWARDNGYEVPDRGRISFEVRDAYSAAHQVTSADAPAE